MGRERDYKKEYEASRENRRQKEKVVSVTINIRLADDFEKKCAKHNTTRHAVLRNYIEQYTYGDSNKAITLSGDSIAPAGMLSSSAWASKAGLSHQRVSQLLRQNRISGAIRKGRFWYIPENATILPPNRKGENTMNIDQNGRVV